MRVLRAAGGVHPGLHRGREGGIRRAVALRAVLGGREGGREEEGGVDNGGGHPGPHQLLQAGPHRPRPAPDAAPPAAAAPLQVRRANHVCNVDMGFNNLQLDCCYSTSSCRALHCIAGLNWY